MMGFLWWMVEHWLLVLYALAVGAGYAIGGWRLALGVATLGGGILTYRQGYKDAEAQADSRADAIELKRGRAYDEIDRRNTDLNDVRERMRKGDY